LGQRLRPAVCKLTRKPTSMALFETRELLRIGAGLFTGREWSRRALN